MRYLLFQSPGNFSNALANKLRAVYSLLKMKNIGRGWYWLSYLLVGLGFLLRIVVWLQQRSIISDEAALLRNYGERTYGQLFQNLDYEQYAPPLFSVAVKASVQAFGNNELAARLFPLLCSLATLVLFRRLAQRWLPPVFACLALCFVAFGAVFIDYATECKQYATDGLVVLGLLEIAHQVGRRPLNGRRALLLAGLGAVAVWLSMAAVFALAGIGPWLLVRSLRAKDHRATARVVAIGVGWLASFSVYFFLLLKTNAESAYLQNYHHDYFLAFPPLSGPALRLLGTQLQLIADRAIGKTVLAIALAAIGFAVGAWQLLRQRNELFWLALGPIVACLAASALRYYSLAPRLMLFFLPLVILTVCVGLAGLAERPVPRAIILILLVVVLGEHQRLRNLFVPYYGDYGEIRDGLAYISWHQQAGEVALMNRDVAPVVRYYLREHRPPLALKSVLLQERDGGPTGSLQDAIVQLRQQGTRRVWLLYDRDDDSISLFAATQGQVLQRYNFQRGYVLLLEFK